MSVARVTEIIASSTVGFDDAIKSGVTRAGQTLDNISSAWVQDQKCIIDGGEIVEYRVNLKITFILKD